MESRQVTPRPRNDLKTGLEQRYGKKAKCGSILALNNQPTEAVVVLSAMIDFCTDNHLKMDDELNAQRYRPV